MHQSLRTEWKKKVRILAHKIAKTEKKHRKQNACVSEKERKLHTKGVRDIDRQSERER